MPPPSRLVKVLRSLSTVEKLLALDMFPVVTPGGKIHREEWFRAALDICLARVTAVRDCLLATIKTLPEHLRKSLTWDQGSELAKHVEITLATQMDIYFCDPHSPWQRGSNENTNGLLRQYFPKGTDLSVHTPQRLLEVATELNARPRKTLGGITPAKAMQRLLFDPERPIVATTA